MIRCAKIEKETGPGTDTNGKCMRAAVPGLLLCREHTTREAMEKRIVELTIALEAIIDLPQQSEEVAQALEDDGHAADVFDSGRAALP